MREPVWVNLTVGMETERLPVYVAAMQDLCLLGLDYLSCVEMYVNLHSGRMSVRSDEVPLNLGGTRSDRKGRGTQKAIGHAATSLQLTQVKLVT